MAFRDFAYGADASTGTATVATSTDTLNVVAGDLIFVCVGHEGASTTLNGASCTDNDAGGSNTYTFIKGDDGHTNNDLWASGWYGIAKATNSALTITVNLGANRGFKNIHAYSASVATGGNTWSYDTVATVATGTSTTPSTGSTANAGAGFAVAWFPMYGTRTLTAGSGWARPAVMPASSLQSEYQVLTAAGSITGNGTVATSIEWIAETIIFKEVAGATSYTLAANQGSYTITGQNANTISSKILTADQGNYSFSGQAATLIYSAGTTAYSITADYGIYNVTGSSAFIDSILVANFNTYSITGFDATLIYTPFSGVVNYSLTADVGTYNITGQSTEFFRNYTLNAATTTYSFSGIAAGLSWSGVPPVINRGKRFGIKMSIGI